MNAAPQPGLGRSPAPTLALEGLTRRFGGLLGGDIQRLVQGDSYYDPKAVVDAGAKLVNVEQAVIASRTRSSASYWGRTA